MSSRHTYLMVAPQCLANTHVLYERIRLHILMNFREALTVTVYSIWISNAEMRCSVAVCQLEDRRPRVSSCDCQHRLGHL